MGSLLVAVALIILLVGAWRIGYETGKNDGWVEAMDDVKRWKCGETPK